MKKKDIDLSVEELEVLCHLYIECTLSVLEETELYYVLLKTDKDSALISEVRTMMGIERKIAASRLNIRKKQFYRKIASYGAAATLALIVMLSFPLVFKKGSVKTPVANMECIVYSNGKRVSGEEAVSIAQTNINQIEEFEKFIQSNIEKENQEIEIFITNLKLTK